MALTRSEDMDLWKIQIHKDEQWAFMDELGKLGICHFVDLNNDKGPHELPYSSDLRNLDQALNKIFELERIYTNYGVKMIPCANIQEFLDSLQLIQGDRPLLFDEINQDVAKQHAHIKEQLKLFEQEVVKFKNLALKMQILTKARQVIGSNQQFNASSGDEENQTGLQENLLATQISYMGGVISTEEIGKFKKMIIRATRAQTLVHDFPLLLPDTEKIANDPYDENKKIIIMAFQDGTVIREKLKRVVASFESDFYTINTESLTEEKNSVNLQKEETKAVIVQSKTMFREYLTMTDKKGDAQVSVFKMYKLFIQREKFIYQTLNMFRPLNNDKDSQINQGVAWCPTAANLEFVLANIRDAKNFLGLSYEKINTENLNLTIPSSFQKNDFINVFQLIVDTYGTPNYKEFNPAVPAIVSFPFLFGVMFGDIMHGALLTIFGIYLCMSKREKGTLGAAFAQVRYLFLMMGFFSLYCGLIYNDFTSLPVMIAKTCWDWPEESVIQDAKNAKQPGVNAVRPDKDCVYPFGLDYTWMRSAQEIVYLNNFKMKTAVMYGVAQMLFGTTLRISNFIYQKKYLDVVVEGVTQFVMLTFLFGFMDYMIIGKWLTDWDYELKTNNKQPPGVIMAMIVMFLSGGEFEKLPGENTPQWGDFVPNQKQSMQIAVVVAFLCVPIMLLVKPFYYSRAHKTHEDNYQKETGVANVQDLNLPLNDDEDHSFGQLFIHQMIETIEYSLGTVSNTASYLRLWALSLAHGQLAKVFFDQTLGAVLSSGGYVGLFMMYYVFFGCTFAVLMCMDLLEAFLHTLRLHWVEFQNKFFKGTGTAFKPYAFDPIFTDNEK